MKFVELYIGAVILWTIFYLIGKILFEEKSKPNYVKILLTMAVFSASLAHINYVNSDGVMKIICVYSLFCLFYKIVFQKELSNVLVASLILYLCLCASEVLVAIAASIILIMSNQSL